MPSLWKKHKKGKKISRLVVDLQTCPKQHETLVVDNGVSTSLDDIGKNKDKLKKLSKKKQRSSKKYSTPITMEEYDHSSLPVLQKLNDGKDKHDQPEFKQRNGDIEVVMNTGLIHTKSKKEAQENGDELQVKDDITIVDEGNGGGSNKVVVKQVNMDNKPVNASSSSEDEKIWNEIINEIDSLEQNYSVWPRQSPQVVRNPAESADEDCGQLGKIESKGKTKTIDDSSNDVVIERGKLKKRRKFWKKLVPKHMRKNKKNKYAKEGHETSVDFVKENETEFEETEMEVEDSSSISSDENEDGEEQYASANNSYNERSRANNGGTKKDIAKENKKDIVKVLIVMIIPLVGLLGGRVFAFVLTLIGCVLFNMLRD